MSARWGKPYAARTVDKTALRSVLHPYSLWERQPSAEWERESRLALARLLNLLKELRPEGQYRASQGWCRLGYLPRLGAVWRALADGRYPDACVALDELIYFEPIGQPRILENVIALLSDCVGGDISCGFGK